MNLKRLGVIVLCVVGVLGAFNTAEAGSVTNLEVGDFIKIYDGPGSPGGEFRVDILGKGATAAPYDFTTFCVELNENVDNSGGTTYRVASISDSAIHGGLGGGDPDPLRGASTYLIAGFYKGTIGYSSTAAYANAYQEILWTFEQELTAAQWATLLGGTNVTTSNNHLIYGITDPTVRNWASNLYNAALAAEAGGYYNTNAKVINIEEWNGTRWVARQSQSVLVPEPTTLFLLGIGLVGVGFAAARRRRIG